MISLKNEAVDDIASVSAPSAVQELKYWQELSFVFEMDKDKASNSRKPRRSRSTSISNNNTREEQSSGVEGVNVHEAALLAQFAAAAATGEFDQTFSSMLPQGSYPSMAPAPGFYGNFMHHNNMQLPPLSSLDFPWHALPPPHPQAGPSHYNPLQASSSSMHPMAYLDPRYGTFPYPPLQATLSHPRQAHQGQSETTSHSAHSPEAEQTETDRAAISDEKRRRNTAASARFRIKKKHKTINLERSVSDLRGRAEELEREVSDLRKENGWLKEIVMLKGTRYATNNLSHHLALNQAALAAGSHASIDRDSSRSGAGPNPNDESDDSSDDPPSDQEDTTRKKKGKGKQTTKSRKK
ncbi:hypothetical protein B0H34DRAFT_792875 [Crassisporium funariophilum]|nr:hypothetical protein B0H34DRAFT_792875 [Crassisporium funariophilum]